MLDEGLVIHPEDPRVNAVVNLVHVELGVMAQELWKVPPYLLLLSKLHHERGADLEAHEGRVDFHAVRLVSALLLFRHEPGMHPLAPFEIAESARALHFTPPRLRVLLAELSRAEAKAAALLGAE